MTKRVFAAMLLGAVLVGAPGMAAAAPAPAATNGDVLFARGSAQGQFLYRVQPDGTDRREVRRLVADPAAGWRPVGVSPEGRRLLFWRAVGREVVLTATNVDGSRPADLAGFADSDATPLAAWSPDGLEIAVVHGNRLFTVPADGTSSPERRPRNLPAGPIVGLQWHPNGDRILLTIPAGDDLVLWSVDRDGGDHAEVLRAANTDERNFGELRMSPDANAVAYLVDTNTTQSTDCSWDEVGVIDLASGDRRVVRPAGAICRLRVPTWSPDGDHLLFEGYLYDAGSWIYRVDLAAATTHRLTGPREGVSDSLVGWEPTPDLLARACPSGRVPSAGFPDTAGTAHARGIDCAAWWDVASGRNDGTYGPGVPVTRAQMASFVARALEAAGVVLPEVSGSRFDDVDATSAHGRRIEQLAELGLVDGIAPGRYAPGRAVTRAQMARFLVGAYEVAAGQRLPTLPDAFVDDDGIALESSVNAASSIGLASGVEASRYAPGDPVNRGQMATFLSRLVDRLARDLDLPAR